MSVEVNPAARRLRVADDLEIHANASTHVEGSIIDVVISEPLPRAAP